LLLEWNEAYSAAGVTHDCYNARVGLSREFARGSYGSDYKSSGRVALEYLLIQFRCKKKILSFYQLDGFSSFSLPQIGP
jgi:hypothetical protein